ncbi:MAG TPA: ribonuclease J [Patescibacteria group bacterium]
MSIFKQNSKNLKILPLGGIGTVTKNMYVYQYGNEAIIVECGVGFPEVEMLGVDFVIPDISYLRSNPNLKLHGIFITHGHDDHLGALPYILPELKLPVFATPITCALIEARLDQTQKQNKFEINRVETGKTIQRGSFSVEFVRITHSVPQSANFAIRTPAATVYHASDFKFDFTPVDGSPPDIARIAQIGEEGVDLLMSDCLRAEKPGYTLTEKTLDDMFEREFQKSPKKIFVTTTSSNLSRVKQAIEIGAKFNRKPVLVGRSMEKAVNAGIKIGYFKDLKIIPVDKTRGIPPNQLLFLVAGSQGQVGSSLSQIANVEHQVSVEKDDTVIFSADPIPGNFDAVHNVIDSLTQLGARVLYSDILDDLHVSGHAAANELLMMMGLLKPNYVMPISGTPRHMKAYSNLAKSMGYPENRIILLEEGQTIEVSRDRVTLGERVESKNIMVDGIGVGDVGNVVLRDRKILSADGIVVVIVPIDHQTGQVVGEPDVVSRGFVYVNESKKLMHDTKQVVKNCLTQHQGNVTDWRFLRGKIEDNLERFLYNETKRHPMILPVIIEV